MTKRFGIAGVMGLLATSGALAGSVNQPGFTTGAPVYGAFPVGLYLIAIPQYGVRSSSPTVTVNSLTPFFFYQSPWKIYGFDIAAVFSPIYVEAKVGNGPTNSNFYNTYGGVQFTHQFGNGWGAGFRVGGYAPGGRNNTVAYGFGTVDGRFGITYLKDGTDFTLNFNPGAPIESGLRTAPNYFNVDLTLTQTFGKIEAGVVAFASTDLDQPYVGYKKQQQVAVGPLIGYNFGPVDVQIKLTSDVAERNYGGRDRRAWADVIIPFNAPAPKPEGRPAP